LGSKPIKILCIRFGNPKPLYEIKYFLFRKQTVPNIGNYKENKVCQEFTTANPTPSRDFRISKRLRRRFAYTGAFVPQETPALYTTKSLNFIMLINRTLLF